MAGMTLYYAGLSRWYFNHLLGHRQTSHVGSAVLFYLDDNKRAAETELRALTGEAGKAARAAINGKTRGRGG